ncbi:MAG TPA: kelch repeat-containing protein [Planctomycetota bacterium]|jgi:hypothetical protein|nr:kelch repeat-containing protein [Planctomycetota bacterium]
MTRVLLFGVPLLVLCAPAGAQTLSLSKAGGAAPGTTTLSLAGGPAGAPYIVLFSFDEQPTTVNGVTLEIPLTWIDFAGILPGFLGLLDAYGEASTGFALPAGLPAVLDATISIQAVAGLAPSTVSNLVRVTPAEPGTFEPALESPAVPVEGGGGVAAGNGEILFVGGSGPVAQRYDSRIEAWTLAGATFGVGLFSQTTPLADGRVLFTGGLDLATGQPTSAAAVYDPVAGTTTPLAMNAARAGHGASLLGNGTVLITGGFQVFDLTNLLLLFQSIQGTTEVFDPATNAFAPGPILLEPRALHTSTTLASGQALIAGGITLVPILNVPLVSNTAYRFNPATGSFGFPAFFGGARFLHSAVGLPNGKVLLVGGLTLDLTAFLTTGNPLDIVFGTRTDGQLYTPTLFGFGTFAAVNALSEGRAGAGLAVLPDGGALVAGGFNLAIDIPGGIFSATAASSADRFSTATNAFAPTGSMAAARLFPLAAPLPDGTVMVIGGGPFAAEIYQP